MVTWPIDFEFLGNMDCDTLRRLKLALSECRGGSTGYQMFRQVDRILTDREGITHFKTVRAGDCALVDPYVNSVDFPEPEKSTVMISRVVERVKELRSAPIDDCPGHHNF